jgi:hypothetical protein
MIHQPSVLLIISTAAAITSITDAQACATTWDQCGGEGYTGTTSCCDGGAAACVAENQWYSQCKPITGGNVDDTVSTTTDTAPINTDADAACCA